MNIISGLGAEIPGYINFIEKNIEEETDKEF